VVGVGERRNPRRQIMKSIRRISFIAALLFTAAVHAATGTLGVATTDTVTISIDGTKYATARWVVTTAGTAKVTTEVSLDGVNWIPSAYSQRMDAVSANPQVAAWQNTTPVAGSYDTPLPANALAFRVRCGTIGTSTVVQVVGNRVYIPGAPVVATLADVTESGTGAGITATMFDTSGWTSISVQAVSPTTQVFTARIVDDTGTAITGTGAAVFTAASGGIATFTRTSGDIVTSTVAAGGANIYGTLDKRMTVTLPAGGTVSAGRYRMVAAR
jgi:hypothetical protein